MAERIYQKGKNRKIGWDKHEEVKFVHKKTEGDTWQIDSCNSGGAVVQQGTRCNNNHTKEHSCKK